MGHFPYAPGTVGSLLGVAAFLLTRHLAPPLQIVLFTLFFLLGIGISEKAEKTSRQVDPDFIVIDEVAGMWITLFLLWKATLPVLIVGFLLFRLFDIVKFFPLNLFEGFHGGMGIMLDDLAAGMLANVVLRLLLLVNIL